MKPKVYRLKEVAFSVHGSPVAQPRTKARAITARSGRTFAQVYEPGGPARQWKADIKQEAIKHKPPAPFLGAIYLNLKFYLIRPRSLYRRKDSNGPISHTGRPDCDNLFKAVADALTGIVFRDDSQIAAAVIQKFYTEKDKGPRVEIKIMEKDR